jgi:hypothetical protein
VRRIRRTRIAAAKAPSTIEAMAAISATGDHAPMDRFDVSCVVHVHST